MQWKRKLHMLLGQEPFARYITESEHKILTSDGQRSIRERIYVHTAQMKHRGKHYPPLAAKDPAMQTILGEKTKHECKQQLPLAAINLDGAGSVCMT